MKSSEMPCLLGFIHIIIYTAYYCTKVAKSILAQILIIISTNPPCSVRQNHFSGDQRPAKWETTLYLFAISTHIFGRMCMVANINFSWYIHHLFNRHIQFCV
jgi:hypothetical protein